MSLRTKIAAGVIVLCSTGLTAFLGDWEGKGQNVVYADRLARGLPTVCLGVTRHTSTYAVIVGDYWSPEKCTEVENLVISKGQLALADCVKNERISQNTFDALTSHGHNVGTPSTCASRAVGLINAGRVADGCRALAWGADGRPVWAYVTRADGTKQFVPGLHNRRKAEMELCLK
ncbi:lysozyme [Pseudomonas sp. 3A(2025)]